MDAVDKDSGRSREFHAYRDCVCTGEGRMPAKWCLMNDPLDQDIRQAHPAFRRSVWRWYRGILASR